MRFMSVRPSGLPLLSAGLLLLLLASGLGMNLLSYPASADDAPAPQHSNIGEDSVETYSLTALSSLLLVEAAAAFTELAKVAKTRFGTHPLADEWTKLYFQLGVEGKGTVANMRRLSELEIEMLTDVDAEKHSPEIQRQRNILTYYDKVVERLKTQGKTPEEVIVTLDIFQALLLIDPAAARVELETLANVLFPAHPLAAEWTALYFRLSRDKKGSLANVRRLSELELQLLKAVDVEKYDEQIQRQRGILQEYDILAETLQNEGKTLEDVSVKVRRFSEFQESKPRAQQHYAPNEADKHHRAFVSLVSTDSAAAKAELSKYVEMLFGAHALAEEWQQLYLHRARDGETTLAAEQRRLELEIQMLTDVDAEKHAKRIEMLVGELKGTVASIERLKKDSVNPEDVKVVIRFR